MPKRKCTVHEEVVDIIIIRVCVCVLFNNIV